MVGTSGRGQHGGVMVQTNLGGFSWSGMLAAWLHALLVIVFVVASVAGRSSKFRILGWCPFSVSVWRRALIPAVVLICR